MSDLQPQLHQLNKASPLGSEEWSPIQAAWKLDEEAVLVTACLDYRGTTQHDMAILTSQQDSYSHWEKNVKYYMSAYYMLSSYCATA